MKSVDPLHSLRLHTQLSCMRKILWRHRIQFMLVCWSLIRELSRAKDFFVGSDFGK